MFWLGLLLPICYIPGLTGAAIPTQWALMSIIGAWSLRRSGPFDILHILGLIFIAYAILGLWWVPNPLDAGYGLWIVFLWATMFWLGTTLPSLTQLWKGLALGLSISSFIAILQWLGPSPVIVFNNNIAGLLYNRTILGAASALVILGLVTDRLWWYIPALIPGLILSGSRGGLLILAVGLLVRYLHWTIAVALILIGGIVAMWHPSSDDALRLQIWSIAWANLSVFGIGPGTFGQIWYISGLEAIHPEFTHNDYLQLWFEYGAFALIPIAILGSAITWSGSPVLIAFATLGLFYFPLYCPLTAFIGCVLAGHAIRSLTLDGLLLRHCRPDLLPLAPPNRRQSVPIHSRI